MQMIARAEEIAIPLLEDIHSPDRNGMTTAEDYGVLDTLFTAISAIMPGSLPPRTAAVFARLSSELIRELTAAAIEDARERGQLMVTDGPGDTP